MYQRVEADAVSSNFDYRSSLLTIYSQLRSSEVQAMKFLCSDVISVAKMEKIQTALDLFQELEKLQRIGEPDNVLLLAELLYHVGRSDQLKTLRFTKETVAAAVREKSSLDRFRVMLFKLSEQLTMNETKDLLFIYGRDLPRSKRVTIEKPEELFQALEKQCFLTRHNLIDILDMMKSIGRSDLCHLVIEYLESDTERAAQMQNFLAHDETVRVQNDLDRILNVGVKDIPQKVPDAAYSRLSKENQYAPLNNPLQASGKICQPITESDHAIFRQGIQEGGGKAGHCHEFRTRVSRTYSCEDNSAAGPRSGVVQLVEDDSVELPCYPMTRKPRGLCIIINNQSFYKVDEDSSSRKMPDREGTQRDAKLLEELFAEKLKFSTVTYRDLRAEEMKTKLLAVAFDVDHSKYDCFVCCILSHGVLGSIYGVDGKTVEIKDLTSFFKGASCPSLRGKPKIFFIQACQGKDKQVGYALAAEGPLSIPQQDGPDAEELPGETIPNEADFLIGYATVPGYVSFRSKSQGSWYINTLVQMLHKYVNRYDLLSILIKVNEEVGRAIAAMKDGNYKQSPMPMATLRKRIFFR